MIERFDIAGYCRISVDEELDRDNVSIENQKAIIKDYVNTNFPGSTLTFFEDRDRSGYTFDQRESYQTMRRGLLSRKYDILVVKDFSRFSRRNSRGLVELEDLRDAGIRIISIGDSVDFPNDDEWLKIQFQFLINEMPVTDASKKVRSVIKRRQKDGQWICSAPYGYAINKKKEFEIIPQEAEIVKLVFKLYNEDGWGYKRIANYLTEQKIPTPRSSMKQRREQEGLPVKVQSKNEWSILTIQGILDNDFYIGTFRQGKYTRAKINGKDVRVDESEHIVIENHHPEIIPYRTFATTRALREKRTRCNYRGVKIYDNFYSGLLFCGDCGSPMFSRSSKTLAPSYICGSYHRRGLKGCTSHHIRCDNLDNLIKSYIQMVLSCSEDMIKQITEDLENEDKDVEKTETSADRLAEILDDLKNELKATKRQRIRDVMKHPDQEEEISETYEEMEEDLRRKIEGVNNQIALLLDKRNAILQINRVAQTALDIFEDILKQDKLDKISLDLIVEKISVYEDHIEIKFKNDIEQILSLSTMEDAVNFNQDIENLNCRIVQTAKKQKDKVFDVHVISDGDPSQMTLTPFNLFYLAITHLAKRISA